MIIRTHYSMFMVGQSSESAAILYTALNAGHVCLVMLLVLIAITDSANLRTGRKSLFVFLQGLGYIIGTGIYSWLSV